MQTNNGAKYDPDEFFNRKKPTNADRIRNLSDEELAFILASPSVEIPPWCVNHLKCPHMDKDPVPCDECALEWLQQEVDNGSD